MLLSARLFCALLCLVTTDGLLDAGMRRSRWTRSSLLVPALLIELAATEARAGIYSGGLRPEHVV